ncbi:MAG: hypothetical protein B7Y00_02285 [Sphingomonadales bacterium 17-56-6]|nr:MAG: hypothetical protein B7Y44_05260 [Sphingomonadales bacterium 28-55-16]OYZ89056.1 MAG: hypothetical protein B7Y00_02285 [Sphingomonadales bacterium 17-56-6]
MPDTREQTAALIGAYYAAFNAMDVEAILACLDEDVAHDINQGSRETGKDAFRAFLGRMDHAYSEQLHDIAIMTNQDGTRAAAEFMVDGVYKVADEGFPAAHGQSYTLPAGGFFEIENGKITRVSVYYNLTEWIAQVS